MKVGIDLAPLGFRSRAPGTAVHVENQTRALLKLDVEWQWILVATPRVLRDTPFFQPLDPIVVSDAPLSYHVFCRLGGIWQRAGCSLGLATAFFAPLNGPPVVTNYFDANSLHPIRDERSMQERLKSRIVKGLVGISRRRSRALFILSKYGRSQVIASDPGSASKWVVAPCGLPPLGEPSPQPPRWAEALEGGPFILYAGAFSENKNQRRLIKAWDMLRERHVKLPKLVLIGPLPESYLKEVIEPARANVADPDEIIITGFVPQAEVAWAFHHAHSYVQPSFAEGFGLPVIQAMHCGVPVACSNSTSLPEVAGNAALFFDPAGVESIASVLEKLVFDEPQRARLKLAGAERAKLFTWQRHAEIVASRVRQELALLPKR